MGDLLEPLLLGGLGKALIVVIPLLILVVLCRAQMLEQFGVELDRIGAVDPQIFSGDALEQVIKDLGVGPLLVGGKGKDPLNDLQVLFLGQSGGKGIPVAGLTLAGKGPQQVEPGLALFKGNGHTAFLLFYEYGKYVHLRGRLCATGAGLTPGAGCGGFLTLPAAFPAAA